MIIANGMNKTKHCYFAGFAEALNDIGLAYDIGATQVRRLKCFTSLAGEDIPFGETCKQGKRSGIHIPACYELDPDHYSGDKAVIDKVLSIILKKTGGMMINTIVEQVNRSRNVVLTGAPGTGKTYLAKQIAQMMILKRVVEKEEELTDAERKTLEMRRGFCQFHPSMDYTDFVEGLRPVKPKDGNENIGFARKDGTFKDFCRKAADAQKENPDAKYVFIIDEINRGDIAKIFGELFFSIDPDYRGKKGKIRTQYYNLIDDGDEFKEFFVPENVFIIGTMNDIDRGVESMDFAIRRRFAWREIQPEDTQAAILGAAIKDAAVLERATNRMDNLNKAIAAEEDLGLGPAFRIGAAFFAKLEGDNFEELWKHRLCPLLREYMRGQEDVKNRMTKFKEAFDNEKVSSENSEGAAEA